MTDKPEQISGEETSGNMVINHGATAQTADETPRAAIKNDLPPAEKISAEGVGCKNFSSSTGVAIYSGEKKSLSQKKSTAVGGNYSGVTAAILEAHN